MAGNIIASILLGIATKADVSGLNKTERGLKSVGRTAVRVSRQTSLLGKLSRSIFGAISFDTIRNGFMDYLQFEKDIGAMKSRFFAITKDEKQATEEYKYINDLAIKTANNVKSTADSYSIFYASARRSLGKEGARGVFEAWTKVGRVLHLNEQQFERVTYALREMSSKGTLYSQDLKMQLGTHVPDAVDMATTAIKNMNIAGVDTIEKFQKLTKTNPNSGLMGRFLIGFSKEAEKRFASPEALRKAMQQPDALQQNIANLGWILANKFSESGGRDLLVKVLTGTYDLLNRLPMDRIVVALGSVAKGIGKILDLLIPAIPEIISILRDLAILVLWTKAFSVLKPFFMGLGGFLKGAFLAFGKGHFKKWFLLQILGREFGRTIVKGGLGKMVGAVLVNIVPGIGQIVSILLWIWTAFDIFRGIKTILSNKDKGETTLSQYLADKNISSTNLLGTMLKLQDWNSRTGGNLPDFAVQRLASSYLGKEMGKEFHVTNGGITVNFKGQFLTMDEIEEMLNIQQIQNKDGSISYRQGKLPPKPTTTGADKHDWSFWR